MFNRPDKVGLLYKHRGHSAILFLPIFKILSFPNCMSLGAEVLRECSPSTTCHMSNVTHVTDQVDAHVDIFFKHHLEDLKEGLVNNLYSIRFGKTPVVRNANYYTSEKILFRFF